MKTPLKIGDTIYQFSENYRVYAKDENGRATGAPIYAEHFRPVKIVGEEKRSWVVNDHPPKVGKNRVDAERSHWFTTEGKAAAIWLHANGWRTAEAVRRCYDIGTVKAIAELLIKAGALDAKTIR